MASSCLSVWQQRRQRDSGHGLLAASNEQPKAIRRHGRNVARLRGQPRPTPRRRKDWRHQGSPTGCRSDCSIRHSPTAVVWPSAGRGARSMVRSQKLPLARLLWRRVRRLRRWRHVGRGPASSRRIKHLCWRRRNLQRWIGWRSTFFQDSTHRSANLHFRCRQGGIRRCSLDDRSGNRNNRCVGQLHLHNRDRRVSRLPLRNRNRRVAGFAGLAHHLWAWRAPGERR